MEVIKSAINSIEVLVAENDQLKCVVIPAMGGKILSLYNKALNKEFLWKNENISLAIVAPGGDYDTNFHGGLDELLPNDIPENIDGIDYPDHGELWTTPLAYNIENNAITLSGILTRSGLFYQKTIRLIDGFPAVSLDYTIRNDSATTRHFLWKLHAALAIQRGDLLDTSAAKAQVADPAYSRFSDTNAFDWPMIENTNASIVPAKNNTMDFFYLYGNTQGEMNLLSDNDQSVFSVRYDKNIFPYQWYFASYGGFSDHYTAILEPCTSMPISVNEAKKLAQCTVLKPGGRLNTRVTIFAGDNQPDADNE